MFSNCSTDGIHISAYKYTLFFDNFYAFHNGVYGVFTHETSRGFTNFHIERNGIPGVHFAGASNSFTSGEVIWNGATINSEAAVNVLGGRNIITAIEAEDNSPADSFEDPGGWFLRLPYMKLKRNVVFQHEQPSASSDPRIHRQRALRRRHP